MLIRKAQLEDLDNVARLFDMYRVFYRKDSDILGAQTFIKERLTDEDAVIFVCQNNDQKLVGFTQLYPIFSSTRMKRLWLLNDLYIEKDHRGKGLSKKLIEKCKELAAETNACGLLLETEITNEIGNSLYPSVGFKKNTVTNFYEWTV